MAEFGRGVGPVKRERDRPAGLGGRQDRLAVDHAGGPFLGHQRVQGADQGVPVGQLQFQRPDQHPDFESWTCRHTQGGTLSLRIKTRLRAREGSPPPLAYLTSTSGLRTLVTSCNGSILTPIRVKCMRHIFVIHGPNVLGKTRITASVRAPQGTHESDRTIVLTTALNEAGRFTRISTTLWLLATELSVHAVLTEIQKQFQNRCPLEDGEDLVLIEASDFVASAPEHVIEQMRAIFHPQKTPQSRPVSAVVAPPKPKPSHKKKSSSSDWKKHTAKKLGVKPTDAMLLRLPGSYGSRAH